MGGMRGDYRNLFPEPPPAAERRRISDARGRGRNIDVEQLWRFVSTYDYVAGDFMWTGIDYLGESRWPGKGASAGVHRYAAASRRTASISTRASGPRSPCCTCSRTGTGRAGKASSFRVTCYTNCDTVELFLNGNPVGVKGYAFPRFGMEERYGNTGRARTRSPHHQRSAPVLGRALRARHAESGGHARTARSWSPRKCPRQENPPQSASRWIAPTIAPTAATWRTSP